MKSKNIQMINKILDIIWPLLLAAIVCAAFLLGFSMGDCNANGKFSRGFNMGIGTSNEQTKNHCPNTTGNLTIECGVFHAVDRISSDSGILVINEFEQEKP